MEEYYNQQREYERSLSYSVRKNLEILRLFNEEVNKNFNDILVALDEVDEEVHTDINERQDDQDLPTDEKIIELYVEALLDSYVDPDATIFLHDILEQERVINN